MSDVCTDVCEEEISCNLVSYDVVVKTGDQHNANTDCKVFIQIVGTKTCTGFKKLSHLLRDDFEKGDVNRFVIKDQNVGMIEYIAIEIKPSRVRNVASDENWYVEWITVRQQKSTDEPTIFPIYAWITKKDGVKYLFTNNTCLSQNESKVRKQNNHRPGQTLAKTVNWMGEEEKLEFFEQGHNPDHEHKAVVLDIVQQLPGSSDKIVHSNLDLNVQFTDEKDYSFANNRKTAVTRGRKKVIKHYITLGKAYNYDTLDDYKLSAKCLRPFNECVWLEDTNIKGRDIHDTVDRVNPLQNPKISHWSHDIEFGRQILNGINPNMIEKCKRLPENFAITNKQLKGLLPKGTTLNDEINYGNIYIINYKILHGVSAGKYPMGLQPKNQRQLELASPICLFHLDRTEKEFKPIAIQLEQFSKTPGEKVPIWTPKDYNPSADVYDWLLAKMWFKHSDFQVHQMRSHLALTHLLIEPIAIATFRQLPPVHPIHKLLREHIQFVIAINTYGRDSLIRKGGAGDRVLTIGHGSDGILQLIAKSMQEFRFDIHWDYEKGVDERDVWDLPNYFARDDALALWKTFKKYVTGVIDIFYLDDNDVKEDVELAMWMKDITRYGLRYKKKDQDGNAYIEYDCDGNKMYSLVPGLDEILETKEALVDIVTKVVYQSSVSHAQVNFLQYEYGVFTPNCPAVMRGKIPKESDRKKITMECVMKSLSGFKASLVQAGAAFTLSEFSEKEVFLLPKTELAEKGGWNDIMTPRCSDHKCPCENRSNYKRKKSTASAPHKCDFTCKRCAPEYVKYNLSDSGASNIYRSDPSVHDFFPPRWLFTENEVDIAYNKFVSDLRDIQNDILKRREKGTTPYEVLMPSRIPYGIAI